MAEQPDVKATQKPGHPWVTRAEAIAVLALAFVLIVWVGVIIVRQRQAGRGLRWTQGEADGAGFRVDLNHADAAELMLLPGIGPGRAGRIIAWRKDHGAFHSLEEFRKGAGLPAKDLDAMRSLVTLGGPAAQAEVDESEGEAPLPDSAYAEPETE